MIGVEIFPGPQSCEQGCFHCLLARKEHSPLLRGIHPEVQKSFSLLEKAFHAFNQEYDLHFGSTSEAYPDLSFPKLIHMARFETEKMIFEHTGPERFTENIKKLVEGRSMTPRVIGFSIVPVQPLLSEKEHLTMQKTIDEISKWHSGDIEVSIRNNMVKRKTFDTALSHLPENDNQNIQPIIYRWSGEHIAGEPTHINMPGSKVYYNAYSSLRDGKKLVITHRVIRENDRSPLIELYQQQADFLLPIKPNEISIALSSDSIILMHSSPSINNFLLQTTHTDFRSLLEIHIHKEDFSFLIFLQNIIFQNKVLYSFFKEKTKLPDKYFPYFAEINRSIFKENLLKHNS